MSAHMRAHARTCTHTHARTHTHTLVHETRAIPRRPPQLRVCPTGIRTATATRGCGRRRRAVNPEGAAL
eukprot:6666885-Alexandrium_andersonii.AAC.1